VTREIGICKLTKILPRILVVAPGGSMERFKMAEKNVPTQRLYIYTPKQSMPVQFIII
jgi:hypothetical protein